MSPRTILKSNSLKLKACQNEHNSVIHEYRNKNFAADIQRNVTSYSILPKNLFFLQVNIRLGVDNSNYITCDGSDKWRHQSCSAMWPIVRYFTVIRHWRIPIEITHIIVWRSLGWKFAYFYTFFSVGLMCVSYLCICESSLW